MVEGHEPQPPGLRCAATHEQDGIANQSAELLDGRKNRLPEQAVRTVQDARGVSDELGCREQGIVALGQLVVDDVADRNSRRPLAVHALGELASYIRWCHDRGVHDARL